MNTKTRGRKEGSTCFLAVPLGELNKVLGPDAVIQVGKRWFIEMNTARIENGEAYSFIPASPAAKTAGDVEEEESEPEIDIS